MIEKLEVEKFRGLENVELLIGKNLTAIAGQNGTLKSTLLASLVQPFGIGRGHKEEYITKKEIDECRIVSKNFNTKINDIFKFSNTFDKPGDHLYHVHFTSNFEKKGLVKENPSQVKSYSRSDKTRVRLVVGKKRDAGYGNIPVPVTYLGLSRLYPIGEGAAEFKNSQLTDEEKEFFQLHYSNILLLVDEKYEEAVTVEKANNSVSTTALNTQSYDWQSISAGQDNVGRIISSILEFKRLKNILGSRYQGGILLIDEVESTLYPRAQVELIRFLNTQASKLGLQIIFTTHSLEILKELISIDKFKYNSKINFMANETGTLLRKELLTYEDIYTNLMVETSKEKLKYPKINVYLEDEEAAVVLKNMLSAKVKKYINIISLELGCPQIAAICTKIDELKKGIIVLDGDSKSNRGVKSSANKHKGIFFLPGIESPEREMINFLEDLPKEDSLWSETKNGFYKQQFMASLIGVDQANRIEVKKWFNESKKHFGPNANIFFKRWFKEENITEEVEDTEKVFVEYLKKCYNANYGINIL